MPDKPWSDRVDHMVEFIDRIEHYLSGVSEADFLNNPMLVDAVARNLELIGEASTHIPDDIKLKYPDLPWAEMRGLRIVLAHMYMGADNTILWATAQQRLKDLRRRLLEILAAELRS